MRKKRGKMRRKRGKMRRKRENHSDPIYTNPIKNLPNPVKHRLSYECSFTGNAPKLSRNHQAFIWWVQKNPATLYRVHAKGVVLCERTCFCLLSTF